MYDAFVFVRPTGSNSRNKQFFRRCHRRPQEERDNAMAEEGMDGWIMAIDDTVKIM